VGQFDLFALALFDFPVLAYVSLRRSVRLFLELANGERPRLFSFAGELAFEVNTSVRLALSVST
jgi:hypothetical protein